MKAKKTKNIFSHKQIMGTLAFVLAAGGYGGYEVIKTYGKYGTNFETRPHVVQSVLDGDTIVIEDGIRVRLLSIDAPEINECYGKESKDYLTKLLLGKEVLLEKDQTSLDSYDRLLRYVVLYSDNPELNNYMINSELVRKGYSKSLYVKPNKKYLSLIQSAQTEAQNDKLGIWNFCEYKVVDNSEREIGIDSFNNECVVKASINKRYERDYFLPGCPDYKRVKVDPRKGEKWFCTEEEAKGDGWKKSQTCSNI